MLSSFTQTHAHRLAASSNPSQPSSQSGRVPGRGFKLRSQWASLMVMKCYAGYPGDEGSIPGSGRYPGGGHVNPLQYSCLKNPMDRGTWWAGVHRVTKSQTRLSEQQRVRGMPGALGEVQMGSLHPEKGSTQGIPSDPF